jgi:hypothetical protein
VDAVRTYLAAGGERAPDPPSGYYPIIPARCTICHAKVTFDIKLSSKQRGAGWRCEVGGLAHCWQRMCQALAQEFTRKHAIQQGLPIPEPLPAEGW